MRVFLAFLACVLVASCGNDGVTAGDKRSPLQGVNDSCGYTVSQWFPQNAWNGGFSGSAYSIFTNDPASGVIRWLPLQLSTGRDSSETHSSQSGVSDDSRCKEFRSAMVDSGVGMGAARKDFDIDIDFRFPEFTLPKLGDGVSPDETVTDVNVTGLMTLDYLKPGAGPLGGSVIEQRQEIPLTISCTKKFQISKLWKRDDGTVDRGDFCETRGADTFCLNYAASRYGDDCSFHSEKFDFKTVAGKTFPVKFAGTLKKGWSLSMPAPVRSGYTFEISHIELR